MGKKDFTNLQIFFEYLHNMIKTHLADTVDSGNEIKVKLNDVIGPFEIKSSFWDDLNFNAPITLLN